MSIDYKAIPGFEPDFLWVENYSKRIIVDRDRKYLYCPIPKCANTAVKHAILGKSDAYQVHEHTFDTLFKIPKPDWPRFLQTARKFLIVRHPYDRVLSAYRNKFCFDKGCHAQYMPDYWKRFYRLILQYSRPKASESEQESPLTFSEFVRFICDQEFEHMNEHWHPQAQLAMLGTIKYDDVIDMHELKLYWPVLASQVGFGALPRSEDIGFSPTNASDHLNEYYTDELRELVHVKFDSDFKYFGYKP